MPEDKCLIHFLRQRTYSASPDNQVGPDADHEVFFPGEASQRTVPTPGATVYYVRKFGVLFSTAGATTLGAFATTTAGGESLLYTLTSADGVTSFGNIADVNGVVTDNTSGTIGATDGLRIVLSCSAGASVNNETSFTINGVTIVLPDETLSNGESITFYISNTGSSYYDTSYMYGGARHTPAPGNADLPFFHPQDCIVDGAWGNDDGIEILDSETYSYPYKASDGNWYDQMTISVTPCAVYAASGVSPRVMGIIGASEYREVSAQHNNTTTAYFNENGSAGGTGSWQSPYDKLSTAHTNRGSRNSLVYGGVGAANGTFDDAVLIVTGTTIEADYGLTPTMASTTAININLLGSGSVNLYGFTFSGNQIGTAITSWSGNDSIRSCSYLAGNAFGIRGDYDPFDGIISHCLYNGRSTGHEFRDLGGSGTVEKCIATNCQYGIRLDAQAATTITISDCLLYENTNSGLFIDHTSAQAGTIRNITSYDNRLYGIRVGAQNFTGTLRDCIAWDNGTYDLFSDGGTATITESNYGTNSGVTIGAGNITTDPKFCRESAPLQLGLSADSGAYRAGTSSEDMGAILRIIEIDNDSIEISGISIDGNNQFNTAVFIADSVDHTGAIIKWCDIYNFSGIEIDLYDNSAALNATVSNNLIHDCGNGVKITHGGNTIEENCVYRCTIFGAHINGADYTINHNVFYLNQYGVYLEANSSTISFKNTITASNSLYGIESEVAIAITYCCITDGVGANVDNSDASNITDKPLFIETTSGNENFNIKTKAGGYTFDSACKDASDDTSFPDIGAFDITRTITEEWWKNYQLATNPTNMNMGLTSKSLRNIEEGLGSIILYAKSHKRVLPFIWDNNAAVTEAQRKTIDYLNTLIRSREINPDASATLTKDQVLFRVHLAPTTLHYTGTATIDASALTLTDVTKSWITNECKAWWAGVKFTSGTGTGTITAATKILQVAPSPAWTNDEWIGYYFYYNFNYYYITDNDADELTLSDPDGTLSDVGSIDWTIEKYFRIARNTDTIATLEDPDGGLVDGSYEYYIDFIECRLQTSRSGYTQLPRFKWSAEELKSGQRIIFEES